jgi:hypothetical protein
MKARLLMIPAVALLLAADKPEDPASKKDLDGLQGTWKLVSAMQDGKSFPRVGAVRHQQGREDRNRRDEKAKGDGRHLDRERSHARNLRTGGEQLQGVLRPGRQATSQRIGFHAREWIHPPGLGAEEVGRC